MRWFKDHYTIKSKIKRLIEMQKWCCISKSGSDNITTSVQTHRIVFNAF